MYSTKHRTLGQYCTLHCMLGQYQAQHRTLGQLQTQHIAPYESGVDLLTIELTASVWMGCVAKKRAGISTPACQNWRGYRVSHFLIYRRSSLFSIPRV